MIDHSRALMDLCGCLRGTPPRQTDWTSVIGLANQTLTTPALIDLVEQFAQALPGDVCAYVRDIYQRNLVRNQRLTGQLEEAVVAMNRCGITPVLLKGTAILATASHERSATRLMADLDVMVAAHETETAVAALTSIGYERHAEAASESPHWYAEFKRPSDVGMVDLQHSAPGPAYLYRPLGHPSDYCMLTLLGRGTVYVPTPTHQATMLILHDEFQDYDYWIGGIDLRHLIELRNLANSPEGIDWVQLSSRAQNKLVRNAVEAQLIALAELLGVDIPRSLRSRLLPRLQFARRMAQASFPIARWPLLAMTILDYSNYRRASRMDHRRTAGGRYRSWSLPSLETLRLILRTAGKPRVGKI